MPNISVAQARWLVVPTVLALWPAWIRHVKFGLQSFPIGLAMFVLLCGCWLWEQRRINGGEEAAVGFSAAAVSLLLLYGLSYGTIPPLGSQVLATLVLACALLASFPRCRVRDRVAYLALLPLTLPVEMALQFVIGFPFRRISAVVAGWLLSPYDVTVNGTTLLYNGHPLEVDAACSGVLGLWSFMIVGALLSLLLRHGWPRLMLTMTVAGAASLVYNVMRTSLLFMYRFHSGPETAAMHSVLGAAAFAVTIAAFALATVRWLTPRVPRRRECVAA